MFEHRIELVCRSVSEVSAARGSLLPEEVREHYGYGMAEVQGRKMRTRIEGAQMGTKIDLLGKQAEVLPAEYQCDPSIELACHILQSDRHPAVPARTCRKPHYELAIRNGASKRVMNRERIQSLFGGTRGHPLGHALTPVAIRCDETRFRDLEVLEQPGERTDIFRDFGSDQQGSEPIQSG
jgi:hypothetical protein